MNYDVQNNGESHMKRYGIRHKETKKMLFVDYEGTQDAEDCVLCRDIIPF